MRGEPFDGPKVAKSVQSGGSRIQRQAVNGVSVGSWGVCSGVYNRVPSWVCGLVLDDRLVGLVTGAHVIL